MFYDRYIVGKQAVHDVEGIILEKIHENSLNTTYKSDGSPQTDADREGEQHLRKVVLAKFPQDGIIGEEYGKLTGTNGHLWYFDPVDGTWSLLSREDTAAISIAHEYDGKVDFAIISNPFTNAFYSAMLGEPVMKGNYVLPFLRKDDPANAVISEHIIPERSEDLIKLVKLDGEGKIGKRKSPKGSVAYSMAQVAEGSSQVYISAFGSPVQEHDIIPGKFIVEQAGGKVQLFDDGKVMVASNNPIIHEKTLDLLVKAGFGNI